MSEQNEHKQSVNKKDIVRTVANVLGMHQKDVDLIIDTVFEAIIVEMLNGGKVNLTNFGVFQTKVRKGQKRVTPTAGEVYTDDKVLPHIEFSGNFKKRF